MNGIDQIIPQATIETIARTLYREAHRYGFHQADYLRLVTRLLEISMRDTAKDPQHRPGARGQLRPACVWKPLQGDDIRIREFTAAEDRALFSKCIEEQTGRYSLLSRTTGAMLTIGQIIGSDQNVLRARAEPGKTGEAAARNLTHLQDHVRG